MKYKLIVFDLDGTLVNSLTDLAIAVNEGLKAAGLPAHKVERYKTFVGNGREKLIERAMEGYYADEALRNIVKNKFDSFYAGHCNDNTSSYNGCTEMLKRLSSIGVKTAVLSNKPDEFVEKILAKVYPLHKFDLAWGKKDEFPTKPDPTALNAILDKLNIDKENCLYIGDSDVDVFTARNAEVDMLGVDWGFRGRAELIEAGADFVASKASEIVEYVNEN